MHNQSYSNDSHLGPGVTHESEVLRLQRKADNLTKKYEHDKSK